MLNSHQHLRPNYPSSEPVRLSNKYTKLESTRMRLIVLLNAIAIWTLACNAQDKTIIEDVYKLERFDSYANDYESAKAACEARNAQLVEIKTAKIQSAVNKLIRETPLEISGKYIGLTRSTDGWKWNDGTRLSWSNWRRDGEKPWQPTEDEDKKCAVTHSYRSGKWHNVACGRSDFGYICQSEIKLALSPLNQEIVAVSGKGNTILSINVTTYDGPAVTVRAYKEPGTTYPIQYIRDVTNSMVTFDLGTTNESLAGGYRFSASTDFSLYSRDATARLTIHVPAKITKLTPTKIQAPVTTGDSNVVCNARGNPDPTVQWFKDGVAVTTSKSSTVYQTRAKSKSCLRIENAAKKDEGTYTCRANNIVGKNKKKITKEREVKLTVFGKPTITNVSFKQCSSDGEINISWKADESTNKVKHRVSVISVPGSNSKPKKKNVTQQTNGKSEMTTKFGGLKLSTTSYKIIITVCPDDCINHLSATKLMHAGNGSHVNISITKNANKTVCKLTWLRPDNEVLDFQVNLTWKYIYLPNGVSSKPNTITSNTSSLEYIAKDPNRNYTTASIRPRTCTGYGPIEKTKVECITKQQGPDLVPTLVIKAGNSTSTQREVVIQLPNEFNGPISCIFVLLRPITIRSNPTRSFNAQQEELEKASTVSMNKSEHDKYYIALAIPRMNIISNQTAVLGDGSETSCKVNVKSRKKRDVSSEYHGKNFPLERLKYRFVTVTTTPVYDGSIIYVASQEKTLDNAAFLTPDENSKVWIAPVIIVIVLIILVIIFIIYKKRRRTSGKTTNHTVELSMDEREPEPNYENVTSRREQQAADTEIRMESFLVIYNALRANDEKEMIAQYQKILSLAQEISKSTTAALSETSRKKNRYKNILPYDDNRVTIGEDYINASFIDGYQQPRKFIATQGPLPQTVKDFWRMVVDQKCKVILMLTRCMEGAKKKCEKYWPDIGNTENQGKVTVTNQEERYFGSFVRRTLKVKSITERELTIHQYQYTKWPDHGVPITTSSFFRMHKEMMKSQNIGSARPPIIVHCSAGCGRTGTFIGYDILLEESQSQNCIDVFGCLSKMRTQRKNMVQNCEQYTYIHKLLVESYLYGDSDIDVSELKKIHDNQSEFSRKIDAEFRNLNSVERSQSVVADANGKFRPFNKNQDIVPYEHSKVIIARQHHDTEEMYLNSSHIEAYEDSRDIIAAQGPMKSTVENFWRAVLDNNVSTIIMLTKLQERTQEQCARYWPLMDENELTVGGMAIKLLEENDSGGIVDRTFEIKRKNEIKKVHQQQYYDWGLTTCPKDPKLLLDIISKLQLSIGAGKDAGILVHCSDGAGRTGAFCAILNLIERVKAENRVDVFRAVKDLRDYRPGMVQTLDQYRFCYEVVLCYLTNCNLYANSAPIQGQNPIYENFTA